MRVYESDLPNDGSSNLLWTVWDDEDSETIAMFTDQEEANTFAHHADFTQINGYLIVFLEKVTKDKNYCVRTR